MEATGCGTASDSGQRLRVESSTFKVKAHGQKRHRRQGCSARPKDCAHSFSSAFECSRPSNTMRSATASPALPTISEHAVRQGCNNLCSGGAAAPRQTTQPMPQIMVFCWSNLLDAGNQLTM